MENLKIISKWNERLAAELSPAGSITGLEVQGNNLIISFEQNIPDGQISMITGQPFSKVFELLHEQAELSYRQGIEDALIRIETNFDERQFRSKAHGEAVQSCFESVEQLL